MRPAHTRGCQLTGMPISRCDTTHKEASDEIDKQCATRYLGQLAAGWPNSASVVVISVPSKSSSEWMVDCAFKRLDVVKYRNMSLCAQVHKLCLTEFVPQVRTLKNHPCLSHVLFPTSTADEREHIPQFCVSSVIFRFSKNETQAR